jgi:hypothetical protein
MSWFYVCYLLNPIIKKIKIKNGISKIKKINFSLNSKKFKNLKNLNLNSKSYVFKEKVAKK